MRPESVEIKVTLADENVVPAIEELGLVDGQPWTIMFCEDVTRGTAPSTPLLENGIVLRARQKSGRRGDSTIKLRPSRWSQLTDAYSSNRKTPGSELKIEADWAGDNKVLATALTADWSDDRIASVRAGTRPVADLFSTDQQRFLDKCATTRVNLAAVTLLPAVQATRWEAFRATADDVELRVRAERWAVDAEIDFLELSIVSEVAGADLAQAALQHFVTSRGLVPDQGMQTKTRRVLNHLVARAID